MKLGVPHFKSQISIQSSPRIGPDGFLARHVLVGGLEHLDFFSIQLGMSSSQLTNSIIFQRGRSGQPPTSVDFPTGFVQTMGDWCSIACLKLVTCTPFRTINWCSHVWKIYLQNRAIFRVSVGKYASTMEHLGGIDVFFSQNMGDGPVHECFRLGCLLADMHNGISVRKEKILVKTRRYQLYIISYIYIII